MNRALHRVLEEKNTIDMTPMLDIVFIMLIFFIVTTSFVKEVGIGVIRPTSTDQFVVVDPVKSLSIRVNEDGTIIINGRASDIQRVQANIQGFLAENNQDSATVQADSKAKHGVVTAVINEVKKAGIEKVALLAAK
jgi:biopolymer transport protein ExbD